MTATISGDAPTSQQQSDLRAAFSLAEKVAHDADGTGQYAHILHKSDVNTLDSTAYSCVIAGGGDSGASARTVEVGTDSRNEIGAHASYTPGAAHYATISGGYDNRNDQIAGTIAGGGHNLLNYVGSHGVIGGGSHNHIFANSDYATISGGTTNEIGTTTDSSASTIAGGYNNEITQGLDNAVGGGRNNTISSSSASGGNAIAGGYGNTISGSGSYGCIDGGSGNTINGTGNGATILGGASNTNSGSYNAIVGQSNTASSSSVGSLVVGLSSASNDAYQTVVGNDLSPPSGLEGSITFGASGAVFGSDGSAQAFSFVQVAQTTDAATAVHMTNRSTTSPTLPLNSAWTGTVSVIGKRAGQISVAAYHFKFCVSRHTSGNIVVEYEPSGASKYLDGTSAPDEPGIGTTNVPRIRTGVSTFQLTVNGAAGVTIDWVARIDAVQVIAA